MRVGRGKNEMYVPSPESAEEIDKWWPDIKFSGVIHKPVIFMRVMRELQRALIRVHFDGMLQEDRVRAKKTLEYLDAIDRGEEVFWNARHG